MKLSDKYTIFENSKIGEIDFKNIEDMVPAAGWWKSDDGFTFLTLEFPEEGLYYDRDDEVSMIGITFNTADTVVDSFSRYIDKEHLENRFEPYVLPLYLQEKITKYMLEDSFYTNLLL